MSGHVSSIGLYVTIFAALMILTAVTVAAAFVDLGAFNFAVAIAIACFKASLVVWFFMHMKWQSSLTKLTLATGLFFLAILAWVVARQTASVVAATELGDLREARAQLEARQAELLTRIRAGKSRRVLIPRAEGLGLRLPADSEIIILQVPGGEKR